MEFRSIYEHGFARVAACTGRVAVADPDANAEMVLRQARECAEEGVAVALFPELTLTGYSIEDLLLQDAVLDGVEAGAGDGGRRRPPTCCRCSCSARRCATATGSTTARSPSTAAASSASSRSPIRRPTASSTRAASSRPASASAARSASAGRTYPFGPDLLFAAEDVPGPRRPRRGLRGHVGPGPAERRGRARGRDRAAQPVRQPDHRRPGRGPQAAVPLRLLALPGRLRLLRRRPGRVDDRPRLGRPDHDLRERRAAGRDRALRRTATGARSPTSTSSCCCRSAGAWAPSTTTAARTATRTGAFRRVGFTLDPPGGDLGLRRAVERFPFVPADPERLELDCYEAYNIQVAGAPAAAAGDRRPEGRDRRLRRPRLDAGADRRRPGDGPRRAPAQRHPRLHAAGLRHQRGHQEQRAPADGRARRHRRGDRHPPDGAS